MSSLNRTEILGIYKKLLRTASKFPQYNYREFAQRRIYDYFVTNKAVRDTDQLVALRKEAEQALSLLQRQVRISQEYPYRPSVIEPLLPRRH
ncbi:Complex1-LYR-dom domain-containing protein [Aphelenchoides besseyi]|nr:Complex1-LYR-dom domain-containing protein [Aphelenchoides besseyi]